MSQYCSRIHIKVSSPKVWKKYEDEDDASFDLAVLAETNQTSYIIDGEWYCFEDEMKGIVRALSKTLGSDGIIIADITNINTDPYEHGFYYLGDRVHQFCFENCSREGMFFETSIEDIPGWLSYGKFKIIEKEKEQLFRCGIATVDSHFKEFSINLSLPTKIYLRETGYQDRPNIIEGLSDNDEVYLVHAADSYDPMRIEVMSGRGSLGYLPSDASDAIAPALVNKRLEYTVRVVELVKLSERNKHARSPIVAISVEAQLANKDVAVKKPEQNLDCNYNNENNECNESDVQYDLDSEIKQYLKPFDILMDEEMHVLFIAFEVDKKYAKERFKDNVLKDYTERTGNTEFDAMYMVPFIYPDGYFPTHTLTAIITDKPIYGLSNIDWENQTYAPDLRDGEFEVIDFMADDFHLEKKGISAEDYMIDYIDEITGWKNGFDMLEDY